MKFLHTLDYAVCYEFHSTALGTFARMTIMYMYAYPFLILVGSCCIAILLELFPNPIQSVSMVRAVSLSEISNSSFS